MKPSICTCSLFKVLYTKYMYLFCQIRQKYKIVIYYYGGRNFDLLDSTLDLLVRINLGFTCLYQLSDEIFGLRKSTTRSRSRNMSFTALGNLIGVGIIPDGVIPHGGNPHGRFPNGGKHIIIIYNKVLISVLFVSMCCLPKMPND